MTKLWSIVLVSAGSAVSAAAIGVTGYVMGKRNVIKGIESGKIRVLSASGKTEVRRSETQAPS